MSKISRLAERLQSQIQQEQEAIESQTSDALTKHAESLKRLSSDALNTTETAIKSESDLLLESITSVRTQAEAHIAKLPQMLWVAMLWPLLLTVMLCILAVAGTWLYLPKTMFQVQTVSREMSNGKTYTVIVNPGWTTCEINKKLYPCAPNQ